jgi:hypothetical protein
MAIRMEVIKHFPVIRGTVIGFSSKWLPQNDAWKSEFVYLCLRKKQRSRNSSIRAEQVVIACPRIGHNLTHGHLLRGDLTPLTLYTSCRNVHVMSRWSPTISSLRWTEQHLWSYRRNITKVVSTRSWCKGWQVYSILSCLGNITFLVVLRSHQPIYSLFFFC